MANIVQNVTQMLTYVTNFDEKIIWKIKSSVKNKSCFFAKGVQLHFCRYRALGRVKACVSSLEN